MAASAIKGVDLFKIAGRSISGWILSLKTGTAIRQPFCSQLELLPSTDAKGEARLVEELAL